MSRDDVYVLHNGIVVNEDAIWEFAHEERRMEIDTEAIAMLAARHLAKGGEVESLAESLLDRIEGVAACAVLLPKLGKLILFSNNGSMYYGTKGDGFVFASEAFALELVGAANVVQVKEGKVLDVPVSEVPAQTVEHGGRLENLVPSLGLSSSEEELLEFPEPQLRRCAKCILPETMPFLRFDEHGVCNYCHHYRLRNKPKPREELLELLTPYRRAGGPEVIVPFSGGRDSCYGLHLIVNELGLRPITYTYDWGMVTDIGRRNISRMSAKLGVENITVAADVSKKRQNIRRNLTAWLHSPHLGMLSMLTAGDTHFFRYVETVKRQTGVSLNLWGINPLEVTHFKAGFLGVPPDFEEQRVYSHGLAKQMRYQRLRFRAMAASPSYFNRSLWDTLSGEYYRSFTKKSDYYHIFDYWKWDESEIDNTLVKDYSWEKACDTSTTWRIGDGTAALYNYAYYTIAGFTEHDTFRSNQVREGDISREDALRLVRQENQPRYPTLKWYLEAIGMDFEPVVKTINGVPKLYDR